MFQLAKTIVRLLLQKEENFPEILKAKIIKPEIQTSKNEYNLYFYSFCENKECIFCLPEKTFISLIEVPLFSESGSGYRI